MYEMVLLQKILEIITENKAALLNDEDKLETIKAFEKLIVKELRDARIQHEKQKKTGNVPPIPPTDNERTNKDI